MAPPPASSPSPEATTRSLPTRRSSACPTRTRASGRRSSSVAGRRPASSPSKRSSRRSPRRPGRSRAPHARRLPRQVRRRPRGAGEGGRLCHVERSDGRREQHAKRSVRLSGPVRAFAEAFAVEFLTYRWHDATYRGRVGQIFVPADLGPIVVGVLGLDSRPVVRPFIVSVPRRPAPVVGVPGPQISSDVPPYSPEQVAGFYDFPPELDGSGQTIGIIELGGGFFTQDIQAYAAQVPGRTSPQIVIRHVDGTMNDPQPAGDVKAYMENLLDIEIIAAVAPARRSSSTSPPTPASGTPSRPRSTTTPTGRRSSRSAGEGRRTPTSGRSITTSSRSS